MTSKLTRERIELIANFHRAMTLPPSHAEIEELARMALAAMDSESNRNPVLAYADSYRDMAKQGVESVPIWSVITDLERNIAPLYRHAQPAPVVMDDIKLRELFDSWFASDCSFDRSPEASEEDNIAWRESYWYVWQRCRATMLQAVPLTNEGDIALHNYRTALEGIGHIRRTLEETFGGLHGTHVEPDVLMDCKTICDAIYAAYSGNSPAIPDRWIPVRERMPESNGVYFGWDGQRVLEVNCFFGGWSANQFIHGEITHWMPLPSAPQEVKGE